MLLLVGKSCRCVVVVVFFLSGASFYLRFFGKIQNFSIFPEVMMVVMMMMTDE